VKLKSLWMVACLGASVGCGGQIEEEQQQTHPSAEHPVMPMNALRICESRTYDMRWPIQYTPSSGYTNYRIDYVSAPSGTWSAHSIYYPSVACPNLSDAVGYTTTYTKNFDSVYSDNSGSCSYTFCYYVIPY
jgi:hypothetical protein